MTRLLAAELRRALSRRATWILLIGGVLLAALSLFGALETTKSLTAQSQADARTTYEVIHSDWQKNHVQLETECRTNIGTDAAPSEIDRTCAQPEPRLEEFLGHTTLLSGLREALMVLLPMLLLLGFVLGSTLVAAEHTSGAMSTLLTFEPRRSRVYVAKLVAATLTALALATVTTLLILGGFVLAYARTSVDPTPPGTTSQVLSTAGRLALAGGLAGLVGAVTGFVLRHTGACLGAAVGYAIAAEMILRQIKPGITPWLIGSNMLGFVQHGLGWQLERCKPGGYECMLIPKYLTFGHSLVFLGVLTVVLTLLGLLSFRRRDVG